MSPGLVAFLTGLTIFLVVYAAKAEPRKRLTRDEFENSKVGTVPVDENASGLFERIVRPAVRNILPQTPMSAQVKARNSTKVAELLVKSGNPWNIQPEEFFGIQIFAGIVGFVATLLLWFIDALPSMLPFYGWLVVGAGLGAFVPKVLLDGAKGRRLKEARRGLPEAVDLLVITLQSGKRLDTALVEVQSQIPEGVIRTELGRVVSDLNAGRDLSSALTDFARRAPSFEVESFAKAIVIAERMGADVTETLQGQAIAARAAYEQMLDAKIGKLPTTLFVPIIALMLPALFLVILAPAFTNIGAAF